MLLIEQEAEVRALLRAVVAGKFNSDPRDDDVPCSPLLARAANRLVDALQSAEIARDGDTAQLNWTVWRRMTPSRPEWAYALSYAERAFSDSWRNWPESKRADVIADLFSPFVADDATTQQFMAELDGLRVRFNEPSRHFQKTRCFTEARSGAFPGGRSFVQNITPRSTG